MPIVAEYPLPVEGLSGFLTDLEEILNAVTSNPRGLIPTYLHQHLEPAWEQVRPLFGAARAALAEIADEEFEHAGLTGPELALKLHAVTEALRSAKEAIKRVAPAAPEALAVALGFANVILKSLPTRILTERIEEYKSVIEKGAQAVSFVVEG